MDIRITYEGGVTKYEVSITDEEKQEYQGNFDPLDQMLFRNCIARNTPVNAIELLALYARNSTKTGEST